eukprot:m.83918 g.83918  ORF g.83918 m.83918 type:complete len:306 (-) comp9570_c0_seq1:15-932(-)
MYMQFNGGSLLSTACSIDDMADDAPADVHVPDDSVLTVDETAALARYGILPKNAISQERLQRLREVHFDNRCLAVSEGVFAIGRDTPTVLHTVMWHQGSKGAPDVPTAVLRALVHRLRQRILPAYDIIKHIIREYEPYSVIENSALYGQRQLKTLVLPDPLTRIGFDAFHGCESLVWVHIPRHVGAIQNRAFAWCSSLSDVQLCCSPLAGYFLTLDKKAFYNCHKLVTIVIPRGALEANPHLPFSPVPQINIGPWALDGWHGKFEEVDILPDGTIRRRYATPLYRCDANGYRIIVPTFTYSDTLQ